MQFARQYESWPSFICETCYFLMRRSGVLERSPKDAVAKKCCRIKLWVFYKSWVNLLSELHDLFYFTVMHPLSTWSSLPINCLKLKDNMYKWILQRWASNGMHEMSSWLCLPNNNRQRSYYVSIRNIRIRSKDGMSHFTMSYSFQLILEICLMRTVTQGPSRINQNRANAD